MVKVRVSVFETNSSSCHALVTGVGGVFKDFMEGHVAWIPYGLEDVPADLAPKCIICGEQDAVMEYLPEKHAAVFLRCSDIVEWAATLPDDHPYRCISNAKSDKEVENFLSDIHIKLQNDFNTPYDVYTWIMCGDVNMAIFYNDQFRMEHDWNTWD